MGLQWHQFGGNLATIQGILSIRPAGRGVTLQFESVTLRIGGSWTVLGGRSAFRGLGINSWVFNTSIEMSFMTDRLVESQINTTLYSQPIEKAQFYLQKLH
ncbi:hypothetical protein DSO57_1018748 [Entomophthora muscae]|uniref:Uncharacterized protein n=1 Tax=Entomophthora muscae TaxID=34485 RepID=A0ACC2RVG5_9FUNG|nr:hypothetical protein DSO57_1018748 [Entomophthora muscae]